MCKFPQRFKKWKQEKTKALTSLTYLNCFLILLFYIFLISRKRKKKY